MARSTTKALLFGLLCGSVLGLLFAPQKGSELRKKMKGERTGGKLGIAPLKDNLLQVATELASAARDLYKTSKVGDFIDSMKSDFAVIPNESVVGFEKHSLKKPLKSKSSKSKKSSKVDRAEGSKE